MEASPTYEPLAQQPGATRLLSAQPDAVLCRLAARGNIGAYDALYQRYRQPIFAFVFHLIGRADAKEDAEDIAQDAFTRAFAGLREKNVEGSFKGWLFMIARNRTYDVLRAKKQNVVSLDADAAEPPVAPRVDEPAERAEQRAELAWLMTAVAELPERQRDALLLREMGGFSHERIAAQMGTSVSATKKLISRGRDGIGEAAQADGYGRVARRRLGHDLAMAAPIVPIGATLAAFGITAGAGTAAAGGAVAGGKVAATALTVLAIGGGAVAVEQKAVQSPDPKPEAAGQKLSSANAVSPQAALPSGATQSRSDGRRSVEAERDRRREDSGRQRGSRGVPNGRAESEPGDDRSGRDSGPRDDPRRGKADDRRGDDRSGRAGSGSDSGSNSGPGGDEAREPSPAEPPESGEDSGSGKSGEDSGPESESSSSGPGPEGSGGPAED